MLEQITLAEVGLAGFIDNDAARISVGVGESRKLAHLRKHQDLSISSLHEFYSRPLRCLARIDSEWNWSDILTKPLDHVLHWRGVAALGLSLPDEFV